MIMTVIAAQFVCLHLPITTSPPPLRPSSSSLCIPNDHKLSLSFLMQLQGAVIGFHGDFLR